MGSPKAATSNSWYRVFIGVIDYSSFNIRIHSSFEFHHPSLTRPYRTLHSHESPAPSHPPPSVSTKTAPPPRYPPPSRRAPAAPAPETSPAPPAASSASSAYRQ